MKLSQQLTRIIDTFYVAPFSALMPLQTFRYGICGGANLALGWVIYYVLYNIVLAKRMTDLGFVIVSPHIMAFLITFPITFLTGFWLQKSIAFKNSPLRTRTQMLRYLVSVCGSVLFNYAGLKLLVEGFGFFPTPSQITVSLVLVAYSYLMQKYFTFRGSSKV